MAIKIYGAYVLPDGSVLDNRFVEFNIPKINEFKSGTIKTGSITNTYAHGVNVEIGNTDATPIDWKDKFLEVFGYEQNQSGDAFGKEVSFFAAADVNAKKYGFTMELKNWNGGNDYTFFIGRQQNGIGFMARNYGYPFYMLQNPTYGAATFEDLWSNIYPTLSGTLMTSLDIIPFCPYIQDWGLWLPINNESEQIAFQKAGLMSINNWYTMLFGEYLSTNVISLELASPAKGLTKVDLSLPIVGENQEARFYTKETEYEGLLPYKSYCSVECQYGTDLTYLFEDMDINKVHVVNLRNGRIEAKWGDVSIDSTVRYAWVITLYSDHDTEPNRGLTYVSGSLSRTASNNNINFDSSHGLYLMCPPNFAEANPSLWTGMVQEITDLLPYLYEYPQAPFAFFSECHSLRREDTGLETVVGNRDIKIPVFTTSYRRTDYASAYEVLASCQSCYATNADSIDKAWWDGFLAGALPRREINVGDGSIGGGLSGSGGGAGNFDDSTATDTSEGMFDSDDFTVIPRPMQKLDKDFKIEVGNMYTNLYMTEVGLKKLSDEVLWKDDFIELIKSKFALIEPASLIMSCKLLPYYPNPNLDDLLQLHQLAGYVFEEVINCAEMPAYTHYNCGKINMKGYTGSFLDYTNAKIEMFLPFVGNVTLSTADVVDREINLRASFDNMAGIVVYNLSDNNNNLIGSWSGSCAVEIPLTSGDFMEKIDKALQAGMAAAATLATAGAAGTLFGAGGQMVKTELTGALAEAATPEAKTEFRNAAEAMNAKTKTAHTIGTVAGVTNIGNALLSKPGNSSASGYSGLAGVLTQMQPFIRIVQNKAPLPANYKQLFGYPTNVTVFMNECSGYTEINTTHLENMGLATETEIAQIINLLQNGVIF